MTYPITNVYEIQGTGGGPFYRYLRGYRQKRPYNLMLPLDIAEANFPLLESSDGGPAWGPFQGGGYASWCQGVTASGIPETDNAAYAGLVGKMKAEKSSIATTLGEHESARAMIAARSKQLFGLTNALLTRDFRRAYRIARKDFPSKGISPTKSFANLYLEWSWGWRPMYEDIVQALDVLTDPITPIYVRAARKKKDEWFQYNSSFNGTVGDQAGILIEREKWKATYVASTGCRVQVENPNVSLANRLGLLEVPKAIWAVQPMSFIVDKYVNIGQMLGSLTDMYGFTVTEPWKSRKIHIEVDRFWKSYWVYAPGSPNQGVVVTDSVKRVGGSAWSKTRTHGLLSPTLAFRTPTISGIGEAISYIALLIQLLKKS